MNDKIKKIIIIGAILLLIIVVSILFFTNKNKRSESLDKKEDYKTGQTQISLNLLIGSKILFPALTDDGKFLVYYDNDRDYVFYKSPADQINAKQKISPVIKDILDAAWNPSREKVILEVVYNKENLSMLGLNNVEPPVIKNSIFILLDTKSQKILPLYKEMNTINWFNNEKIIYTVGDAENQTLYVANSDGSFYKKLLDLNEIKSPISELIASPDGKKILIRAANVLADENSIYLLNTESKTLNKIAEEDVTAPLWSPDGSKFLFLKINDNGEFYLYLVSSEGKEIKNLEIKTMPRKFIWDADGQNIFVAIPEKIVNMQSFREKFYKANLNTKEKSVLSPKDNRGYFNAQNLMPTKDGKTLYFTSDDLLYRIDMGTGNR